VQHQCNRLRVAKPSGAAGSLTATGFSVGDAARFAPEAMSPVDLSPFASPMGPASARAQRDGE